MELKDKLEDFALWRSIEHFISFYPDDKSPAEILELISAEDSDITVWEPFENWGGNSVVNAIEELAYTLKYQYATVLKKFSKEYLEGGIEPYSVY
jgi:hypothetical protein